MTATRYRKKPIAYEAHQWQPADAESTGRLVGALMTHGVRHQCTASTGARTVITIRTLEGDMTAQPGDWVIIGHKPGEAWPVRGDIFAETYEPAASAAVSPPTDRAAWLEQAASIAEDVAESLRKHHEFERSNGALDVMTELRRLAVEAHGTGTQQQCPNARCPSCDHEAQYHDADGRCWFTVDSGVPGSNLVCPCGPRRVNDEEDGAQQQAHAEGEHCFCGPECDAPRCTCADAGDGFVPLGHYRDCPLSDAPRP